MWIFLFLKKVGNCTRLIGRVIAFCWPECRFLASSLTHPSTEILASLCSMYFIFALFCFLGNRAQLGILTPIFFFAICRGEKGRNSQDF